MIERKPKPPGESGIGVQFHAVLEGAAEVSRLVERVWTYQNSGDQMEELWLDALGDFTNSAAPDRLIRRLTEIQAWSADVQLRVGLRKAQARAA